jgi:hypothetical protein
MKAIIGEIEERLGVSVDTPLRDAIAEIVDDAIYNHATAFTMLATDD